jgi:hypothetical protein
LIAFLFTRQYQAQLLSTFLFQMKPVPHKLDPAKITEALEQRGVQGSLTIDKKDQTQVGQLVM